MQDFMTIDDDLGVLTTPTRPFNDLSLFHELGLTKEDEEAILQDLPCNSILNDATLPFGEVDFVQEVAKQPIRNDQLQDNQKLIEEVDALIQSKIPSLPSIDEPQYFITAEPEEDANGGANFDAIITEENGSHEQIASLPTEEPQCFITEILEETSENTHGSDFGMAVVKEEEEQLDRETREASLVLDSLIKGNVRTSLFEENSSDEISVDDYEGDIVIVIAPEEEREHEIYYPESPASSIRSPEPPVKRYEKGRVEKRTKLSIVDKKERKKWQNVEAARRYRDKKKAEMQENALEVQMLQDKNKVLKDRMKDLENEVSTMKKLMVELGYLKNLK